MRKGRVYTARSPAVQFKREVNPEVGNEREWRPWQRGVNTTRQIKWRCFAVVGDVLKQTKKKLRSTVAVFVQMESATAGPRLAGDLSLAIFVEAGNRRAAFATGVCVW